MAEKLPIRIDDETRDRQRVAADPANAAWVSANAGSGKTYVLATRVIRLMLERVAPDTILCLTYTKTAAAEMKNRVFERLAQWALLDDAGLRRELAALENEPEPGRISKPKVDMARTLFAKALETPGGLKIQTIHAFCDSVLHRFPLEANIAGHFEQLDDRMQAAFLAEARNHVLATPDPEIAAPLARLLNGLSDVVLDAVLARAVHDRATFEAYDVAGLTGAQRLTEWRAALGIPEDEDEHTILTGFRALALFDHVRIGALVDAAQHAGAKRAIERLLAVRTALAGKPDVSAQALIAALLKGDGTAFSSSWLFSKALKEASPDCVAWYESAAAAAIETQDRVLLLRSLELGVDLVTVVTAVLEHYAGLKRARGYLDFTDLIDRTRNLLARPDVGPWVRYKLDAGIDHILVDEAQDTSPSQWDVISLLSSDFFAGKGANPQERTIFAVGDEKQSIYSFQGADPGQFSAWKARYADLCAAGERSFAEVPLPASFRSTADVLHAVDLVFAAAGHAAGLSAEAVPVSHRSLRDDAPGRVEIWEPTRTEKQEQPDDWLAPVPPRATGDVELAQRIAGEVRAWLNRGEHLEGRGRAITAGDILILVRNRSGFVSAMSAALKARSVPVAGADRLDMAAHPAVRDLVALGRFVLDETDSLSLAELLKSPLFGGTDDDLFALLRGVDDQTLFERITAMAATDQRMASWLETLTRWQIEAAKTPVFDFYATILTAEKGRRRLVGRLGPETPDVLDEFLNEALAMQRAGQVSLQQFMRSFEQDSRVIKREMDQDADQVRIMTVHGAKGLEAPVVFLVDPGTLPDSGQASRVNYVVSPQPEPADGILLVAAQKSDRPQAFTDALSLSQAAQWDEYRRLLYVGMTRAADRLIVTGYKGANAGSASGIEVAEPARRTWYDMVKAALVDTGQAKPIDEHGFEAWCYRLNPDASPVLVSQEETDETAPLLADDVSWMQSPAPAEPPAPRPLQPSGASVLAIEREEARSASGTQSGPQPSRSLIDALTGQVQSGTGAAASAMAKAARRGTAIHRLLQVLIDMPQTDWRAAARRYLQGFDTSWTSEDIDAMADEVATVLNHPRLRLDAASRARNEVSIMGTVEVNGVPRAVSGAIDRLVVGKSTVKIIDYKTNLRPPQSFEAVPEVYVTQLALYRALAAPLFPSRTVSCTLVYTAGPVVIPIPESAMDSALGRVTQS